MINFFLPFFFFFHLVFFNFVFLPSAVISVSSSPLKSYNNCALLLSVIFLIIFIGLILLMSSLITNYENIIKKNTSLIESIDSFCRFIAIFTIDYNNEIQSEASFIFF
jgi:hypothetical protein